MHVSFPYQLVSGKDPDLPSVLTNNLPALEELLTSDNICKFQCYWGMKSICLQWKSEKHNIYTYNNTRFLNGAIVYYNRNSSKRWKGPGKVLSQDGQEIIIKHGSIYVRCHPCHIALSPNAENSWNISQTSNATTDSTSNKNKTSRMNGDYVESRDEDCSKLVNAQQNESSEDPSTSQPNSCKIQSSKTNSIELKKNQKIAYLANNIVKNGEKLHFYHEEVKPQENIKGAGIHMLINISSTIFVDFERDVENFELSP